jgi:hypothetical protein
LQVDGAGWERGAAYRYARSKTTVNFGGVHFNPFILESLLQAINDESAAVIF